MRFKSIASGFTRFGWGLLPASCLLLSVGLGGCGDNQSGLSEPAPVGGPALMRRLTESQYRATINDVFGPGISIPARFERGLRVEGLLAIGTSESGMSAFSVEQYDAAALSIADTVLGAEHRDRFLNCATASEGAFDAQCTTQFVQQYGMQLWRRPLTDPEVSSLVNAAHQGFIQLGDYYEGLKYALVGLLVAPDFLLRIERTQAPPEGSGPGQLDAFSRAARLSFFLTNASPDKELLRAAAAGELDTPEGLASQVDRLIASSRFTRAVRAFFEDMLQFDLFADLAKDPVIYPAFNSTLAADAQEQTLRTITDLLIEQNGDYRDLFTTRNAHLTRALGIAYRVPVPTRKGWEVSEFSADSNRAGIQTHIAFLALHSHPGRSSPSLRGKAIREVFLCQEVPPPPPEVNFSVVQDPSDANLPTARDRLELHRTEPSCAGCHRIMDPPGLALENFDGLGTFRTVENGAAIDASGSLDGIDFTNTNGLAQALHDHRETPRCLVEKMYRFAVGRDTVWDERPYMDYLTETFAVHSYSVPQLMRAIALSKNFFAIAPPTGETSHNLAGLSPANGATR
ncbi:MAG: DUF1592 domain-containing protein [Halioglobus sp.]|nr:DUF1592 domain-containing protein [Halioglobus sp.]